MLNLLKVVKKKTVADIVSGITKIQKELEAHADTQRTERQSLNNAITALEVKHDTCDQEVIAALRVADNLAKLIEG